MNGFTHAAWVILISAVLALAYGGGAASGSANPPKCDTSQPLADRLRASHWQWFDGERMRDCDADALVEASDALETCEGAP